MGYYSYEEVCELENYAVMWGISGDAFLRPFKKSVNKKQRRVDVDCKKEEDRLSSLNEIRNRIMTPLYELYKSTSGYITYEGVCRAVYEFMNKSGFVSAIEKAAELEKETENAIVLGQFVNEANPEAHYRTTGPEIWKDTDGKADIFIAGAGTGGTVTGVGRYLKEKNPDVEVIAVEPAGSPVLSGGKAGPHGLQGIGAGFIPEILDTEIYDKVNRVKEDEAYAAARLLAAKEGILVGITSGAALHTALQEARRAENTGKVIVALLPDTGERYLSTPLFE